MKLFKWWVLQTDSLPPATELLHVSDDLDELIRIATNRAVGIDNWRDIYWGGKIEGESGSIWMPVRDEFRYVIQW